MSLNHKRLIIAGCVLLLPMYLVAQGAISGSVMDSDGLPIPGANVIISGTSLGASADNGGSFTIENVPGDTYTLVATAIGYARTEQKVSVTDGSTTTVRFELKTDVLGMNSVVVTGVANPV
ncbi:MAG: carboxypeptidase-like regulatory domain-containing protein, partial [Fidelibacterota bacterium]